MQWTVTGMIFTATWIHIRRLPQRPVIGMLVESRGHVAVRVRMHHGLHLALTCGAKHQTEQKNKKSADVHPFSESHFQDHVKIGVRLSRDETTLTKVLPFFESAPPGLSCAEAGFKEPECQKLCQLSASKTDQARMMSLATHALGISCMRAFCIHLRSTSVTL